MQQPGEGYYPSPMAYPYADPPYTYAAPAAVPGHPPYSSPHPYPYAIYGQEGAMYGSPEASKPYWRYATPHPPQVEYYLPSVPRTLGFVPPLAPSNGSPGGPVPRPAADATHMTTPPRTYGGRNGAVGYSADGADGLQTSPRTPGAKNMLDIAAVENGTDTRTTVMIKNIPNKMTDKDLKVFIDRVCPRRIDFMYLRMDFQNGERASPSRSCHLQRLMNDV